MPARWRAARLLALGLVALLFGLPLAASLGFALQAGLEPAGWRGLLAEPALGRSIASSLGCAVAATALSLALTLGLVTTLHGGPHWRALGRTLAPLLALPHAAFAIGLALLVMPSGLLARLAAPLAGWEAPPDWPSVHDPLGLGLVAVLVAKETPFLLWSAFALLARPEVEAQVARQLAIARTLGYARTRAWSRGLWPAWAPRLALPVAAVFGYALGVVDVALVIGPASPPPLAVLAWQWLQDADPQRQAEGAAAALLLGGLLLASAAAAWVVLRALAGLWRVAAVTRGQRGIASPVATSGTRLAMALGLALAALYALVLGLLGFVSVAGGWSFPALRPAAFDAQAWVEVLHSARHVVAFSAGLSAAASALALLLCLAWLESTPARADRVLAPLLLLPLLVPALLLASGLYRAALASALDGRAVGVLLAHVLVVLPYAWIVLAPAWRSFDPRYAATALALGRGRLAFAWRVKLPMLRAPLAAAAAVGFAVSIAQYLPTAFVGAGRHPTITTEAVALASGGERRLAAAFALLQALLPAAAFALAQRARPA